MVLVKEMFTLLTWLRQLKSLCDKSLPVIFSKKPFIHKKNTLYCLFCVGKHNELKINKDKV